MGVTADGGSVSELAELSPSRHDHFFRPCRASAVFTFYPQLTLWAAFFRRFAAEGVGFCVAPALVRLSKIEHYPLDNVV